MPKRLTTEQFIERAKLLYNDRFSYEKVNYINSDTKVIITCHEHGDFLTKPSNFLRGHNCPRCAGRKIFNTEEFIKQAKEIHGDKFDYSKSVYTKSKEKILIHCNTCNKDFWQVARSHLRGFGCPFCYGHYKFSTEEFIEKAKAVHGEKYDYSKVDYVNYSTKILITCPTHGDFLQTPHDHLGGAGCPVCGVERLTMPLDEFISRSRLIHGEKYDYSQVNYINSYTKVKIICPEHGEFMLEPYSHLRGIGCPVCSESKGEKKIRVWCEKYFKRDSDYILKYKSDWLGSQHIDTYFPSLKLGIEYDGEGHFIPVRWNNNWNDQDCIDHLNKVVNWDSDKNKKCRENKVELFRIPYWYYDNIEDILDNLILVPRIVL